MDFKIEYNGQYHNINLMVDVKAPSGDEDRVKDYFEAVQRVTRDFFFHLPENQVAVYMDNYGVNKIAVIKVVREHLRNGLKEAKDLVEMPTPVELADKMSRPLAIDFKNALEAVGATAMVGPKKFHVMK